MPRESMIFVIVYINKLLIGYIRVIFLILVIIKEIEPVGCIILI